MLDDRLVIHYPGSIMRVRTRSYRHPSMGLFEVILLFWLMAGTFVLLCLPSVHWHHPIIGWLPFWGVVAPLLSWLGYRLFLLPRVD